ncbi:dienelactone hydrolase family protein [Gillisia sp. Q332]|uniref:dienelactone hydrolase family protein n=1 Tax=Gillisia xinjiangensis TaxID=3384765 RepID=UPI00391DD7A1
MTNLLKTILYIFLSVILISCGNKNKKEQAETAEDPQSVLDTIQQKTEIQELSDSPRHHEWVTLSHGDREFQAFVVYPETDEKTKSVIVIHENRGLNDWARLFADKLAEKGYLVIAPDLISNTQDGKRRTTDFKNPDAARDAIYALDPDQVTADLDVAYNYIKNDASSTGEVAVVGFCWGGSQTFRYATNNQDITSAHVFYGTAPDDADALAKIKTPVYGYYGGDDNRVNATIEQTKKYMKAANNPYDYEIYEGAGHAFMRSGHQPDGDEANKKAHDAAWKRFLELL